MSLSMNAILPSESTPMAPASQMSTSCREVQWANAPKYIVFSDTLPLVVDMIMMLQR